MRGGCGRIKKGKTAVRPATRAQTGAGGNVHDGMNGYLTGITFTLAVTAEAET